MSTEHPSLVTSVFRVPTPVDSGRFPSLSAEGALDGTAASYEVVSPFATAFAYTRFDAPQLSLADGSEWALPLTGVADEAAASDELQ